MANKTSLLGLAAAASILSYATTADVAMAENAEKEKCYGVVKAGKNDCGSADHSHSCAGGAKEDGAANEWILLEAGVCERLAGGHLEVGGEHNPHDEDEHHHEEESH